MSNENSTTSKNTSSERGTDDSNKSCEDVMNQIIVNKVSEPLLPISEVQKNEVESDELPSNNEEQEEGTLLGIDLNFPPFSSTIFPNV